ncbi:MAG: glycosyltransferase family 4 protein [Gaiellaceae bacterium]
MNIAVDAISAGAGLGSSAGGMIVYFDGLLAALARRDDVDRLISFVQPWAPDVGMPTDPKLDLKPCRGLPRNRFGRVVYEQTIFPLAVDRGPAQVLFSTCNTRPLLLRKPNVVVLQSIQHVFFPSAFGTVRRAYLNAFVPRSLRTADAVIAVSAWEKQEALHLFDLDPDRVFVVHHGVSNAIRAHAAATPSPSATRGGRPTIVMVSALYDFKNHRRLIEAFAALRREHDVPHELVIAGGPADVTLEELQVVAARAGVSDRVRLLGPVPHELVPRLLANAHVVAYPSLFETFGFPILEALSYGAVLVTSAATSMPEVAGDAAILVDPTDTADLAAGLARAIFDRELRERLHATGPGRAAEFTWERCADGTLAALRFALEYPR